MIERLFSILTEAVAGSPAIAIAAAFAWGILSVVLSPCHLSSIPLIVGFISGQGKLTPRRAFGLSTLFALGILVTIGLIGIVTGLLGRMLGDIGPYGRYMVAALFIAIGLHLLGLISMPFSGPAGVKTVRRGYAAALCLGLVFGIAVGPCTFAYLAPVMGVTFSLSATKPLYAASLLLAYGVGHCAVIAVAGGSTGLVQRYLNWNERSSAVTVLKQVCGALVILGGVYLIYTTIR